MSNYILDERGEPRLEPDILKWGQWFETADLMVARTQIGDAVVSTVFLGIDHNYGGGVPVLYETVAFGGALDQDGERYCTRAEAEAGHKALVERVRQSQAQEPTHA